MNLEERCTFKDIFYRDEQKLGHDYSKCLTFNPKDKKLKCRYCNGYEKELCESYITTGDSK